jgi:hypothetical protein|tara:strand:+ start:117 stop:329 length:213 start_codon:yes stop_codon:yes gene_type:complete
MRHRDEETLIYSGENGGARVTCDIGDGAAGAVQACYRLLIAVGFHPTTVAGLMINVGEEQLTSFNFEETE